MLKGFMAELVAWGQQSSKLAESLLLTDLSDLLLAPSICTWPGVDINSWPELELFCHSLSWPAGGRRKAVAEEGPGV